MTASMPQIKFSRRKLMRLAMSAVALPTLPRMACAESYPARPVRIMLGFPPGTTPDVTARLIGPPLSERLGQQFIVENRTGAGGNIATEFVVKAEPDGYTLLLVTLANAVNATLYGSLNFNFLSDIAPVASIMRTPLVMEVNPAVPARSVAEFIAYAKANPGKLSIASGNTAGIVGAKTLAHDAGIDLLHVPYKSSPQAIEDVIAGRVSMMIVDFTVGMPQVTAGQVRALAMTRLKRSALYPDLPTMDEAGIEGFELDAWAGLVAPAKTPPEVIARLNGALRKVINNPDVQAKFKNVGFEASSSTPEEFGAFIKAQLGIWSKMVKDANIQAE